MYRPLRNVGVRLALASALLLLSTNCDRETSNTSVQAYVAPASLNLRSQLSQKNDTVAVLKHGEPVSIVDVRRRYVKIRTRKGAEGWVDSLDLLSASDMRRVERDRKEASALPGEGMATAYESLNIHIDPNRGSPAFAKLSEGESVTILAHKIAPKVSSAVRPPTFVVERPQPPSRRARRERQGAGGLRPPWPRPPKPPANWQELLGGQSHPVGSEEGGTPTSKNESGSSKKGAKLKSPVIMEDWTLIRTPADQTGWVLSRNLMMSIPDDVAQYAEGKHITSYFDLGTVNDDEKGPKHNWLWTTRSGAQTFDFDSWRVFLWNRHRHRFETSYRQRDVEGYFPVHVDAPQAGSNARTFQLIMKDDDGRFRRRTYLFDGTLVHLTATADYQPGQVGQETLHSRENGKNVVKVPRESWLKRQWISLKQHLSKSN